MTAALAPVLSEVAGLPGAPARISQAAPMYSQALGNGIQISAGGTSVAVSPPVSGSQPAFSVVLPDQLPGQPQPVTTAAPFAARIRSNAAPDIIDGVIALQMRVQAGQRIPQGILAAQAVVAVLLREVGLPLSGTGLAGPGGTSGNAMSGPVPGTAVYAAAQRFAALSVAARHAWLVSHLAALRAGHVTLAQLP